MFRGRSGALRRIAGSAAGRVGVGLVAALCLTAILAPLLAPYDPTAQVDIVTNRYASPSGDHPMGTDRFGRDIFSRVLHGARISLGIAVASVAIAITLGTAVGAVAGYWGGRLDTMLMRGVDMLLAFPRLVLLLALAAVFNPSTLLLVLVLGLTGWMGVSRLVRGQVLSLREQTFIEAARALGFSRGRILLRHILPNATGPIIVAATLAIADTILMEAGLSFLGFGVQPPTASWGNMIADGRATLLDAWWISTFPGLAVVITVIGFNLLGEGLRGVFDPRSRVR
ncbi:MAG: ABC transporter permease [Candidatus Eisenbacteria sp.]|nr:ABC transporter permease [Candidatus Eisenbacteria bacterium]